MAFSWIRRRELQPVDAFLWAIEDRDALVRLGAYTELRRLLDPLEAVLIAEARRAGHSWGRIGAYLGLESRQAAHARAVRLGVVEPRPKNLVYLSRRANRSATPAPTSAKTIVNVTIAPNRK